MRFIIPIFVGAIIGYITNWFAIKMLFRPHEKKEFLGFPIPFTPGLIPKERRRMAKSVGEAVGAYLLTPEAILDFLSSDKMNYYIKAWIQSNIDKFKREDRSLFTLVDNLNFKNHNRLLDAIKSKVADFIYFQLRKDSFRQNIMNFMEDAVLNSSINNFYKIINGKIEEFLCQLSTSEEIRKKTLDLLDNSINKLTQDERRLDEVIPQDFIYGVKDHISKYEEGVTNLLRAIFRDPMVEIKIRGSITNIVSHNMNKLIAMVISPEIISEKVFRAIREYIDKPDIKKDIGFVITMGFEKIMENRIGDIVEDISSKFDRDDLLKIINAALNHISNEENQRKIFNIIEGKIKSKESNIKDIILKFLDQQLEIILNSQKFYDNIYLGIDRLIGKVINKPVSVLVKNIDENTIMNIFQIFRDIFHDFIINKLPEIVSLLNISKIVEDQINSFDVDFVEELIIEIANKELKAITWLGALLGGIMGILSPLLQMIK